VYAEIFSFRGYDTSKVDDVREEPVHMVQKGSVIVFKTEKTFNEIFDDFALIRGFGLDVDNGFGWFKFHFVWRCIKMTDLLLKFVENWEVTKVSGVVKTEEEKAVVKKKRLEAAISEVWLFWPTMRIAMKN